jgi:hypothetical protein
MPWGKHKLLSGSLDSNIGNLEQKIVDLQDVPPCVTQMKTCRKFQKSSIKTKYHFRDCWQVRPLIQNMPANYKVRHRTCTVCASVAQ